MQPTLSLLIKTQLTAHLQLTCNILKYRWLTRQPMTQLYIKFFKLVNNLTKSTEPLLSILGGCMCELNLLVCQQAFTCICDLRLLPWWNWYSSFGLCVITQKSYTIKNSLHWQQYLLPTVTSHIIRLVMRHTGNPLCLITVLHLSSLYHCLIPVCSIYHMEMG